MRNKQMLTKDTLNILKSNETALLNEIISSDLVLFGDDHNTNSGRVWLKNLIPQISDNFQNFGLEYMPSPDEEFRNNKDLLRKYLVENYKDFPGLNPDSVIDIVNQCESNKMEVFGIDMPPDYFDDWQNQQNQRERIKFMTKVVMDHLAQGNTLALFGGDHVEIRDDNVYGLIRKERPDVKILSIVFIGGKTWTIDTKDYWIRKLELLAIEQRLQNTFFILNNSDNELRCDFVIHLPQIEKL